MQYASQFSEPSPIAITEKQIHSGFSLDIALGNDPGFRLFFQDSRTRVILAVRKPMMKLVKYIVRNYCYFILNWIIEIVAYVSIVLCPVPDMMKNTSLLSFQKQFLTSGRSEILVTIKRECTHVVMPSFNWNQPLKNSKFVKFQRFSG